MNLYDLDEDELPRNRFILALHDFEFNRDTRRMVCSRCGGKMNEVPERCVPKPL